MIRFVRRNEKGHRIGEDHHRSKFTDHEIELIRQLDADGMKRSDIAKKMDVSKGHISKILRYQQRR